MDKNTYVAIFLIAIIIIVSSFFQGTTTNSVSPTGNKLDSLEIENKNIPEQKPIDIAKDFNIRSTDDTTFAKAEDIFVETPLFQAIFSSEDGIIKSFQLKKYTEVSNKKKFVELIQSNTKNLKSKLHLRNGQILEKINYKVNKTNISLDENNPSDILTFTYTSKDSSFSFQKSYVFYYDKYIFDILTDNTNIKNIISDKGLEFSWMDGLKFTEISDESTTTNEDYFLANYYLPIDEDDAVEFDIDDDQTIYTQKKIHWGATRIKYFEAIISEGRTISENEAKKYGITFSSQFQPAMFDMFSNKKGITPSVNMYSDGGFSVASQLQNDKQRYSCYIGPMENTRLKSYDMLFETTISWGWAVVEPFSKPILSLMLFFHRYIENYGIILIIMSLLINTALSFFYIKSYKSQREQKKIQPLLKEIKEKYKGDIQRQQQETMKLYKEHKINPLGACLPAILPLPVLYAMFIICRGTIELRGEPFIAWITDLSQPEILFSLPFSIPFYGSNVGLMPIIMCVMMFFQMRESAMSADPNQKMLSYMMPVMLLVFFNNLASGLILYYTVGNIFRFIQQKLIAKKIANQNLK